MSKDLLASAIEDMERARGTIEALMGKPHVPDNGLPKTLAQQREEEPVAWTLRWPLDIKRGTVNYMTTFGTKERAREYADKCTDGESIVVAPLYLHPPKPAAQPGITNEMKAACIGEFSWQEEAPYHDEDGDLHADYVATRVVPWDLCKKIYKKMASLAPAAQPQVPEGYQLVPVAATMKIESAIAASRNLKASEIWEDALSAAKEEP